MFLMDYSIEQKVAYDPVVTRMVRFAQARRLLTAGPHNPWNFEGTDPFLLQTDGKEQS
nr:hypothetical protein [Mesorhizobium ciceri]